MASRPRPLAVSVGEARTIPVLTLEGLLDSTTYLNLRDRIIKTALDEPIAVIVDVTRLKVPAESAWSVFTSARWHVSIWPNVPVMLVCAQPEVRDVITRNGITLYVPVYAATDAAVEAGLNTPGRYRRRARAHLPANDTSPRESRRLVRQWLASWSVSALTPVATVIVNALVENVLQHTQCEPDLRVENDGASVTVAVEDSSHTPVRLRERSDGIDKVSGLALVAALSRRWGVAPTPTGKTVWAVIGAENRI